MRKSTRPPGPIGGGTLTGTDVGPVGPRSLTDAALRALRPGAEAIEVRDPGQPGLLVRVLPTGERRFEMRYRFQGQQRRLMIGSFPATGLQAARKTARATLAKIDNGEDPAADRRAAKAKPTDTVDALAADYLEKHARRKKKTAHEDERVLNVYVLPSWRGRSVKAITRRDVRALVEPIAGRAPIMANRVLEIVRKMFNFGIGRDWLDGNPAARVEKPGEERSRDRVLTDDEIKKLWALLERFPTTHEKQAPGRKRARARKAEPFCPLSPALAAVQKLRLLTAQRGGEVVRMKWGDVDLDAGWWTIPAADAKNGEAHRVPLTPDALAIITAQQSAETPADGAFVFTGREGGLVAERMKKAGAACSSVLGFEFRSHDLRRTAATRMAAAGIPREHISRVLNHVAGGPASTRVYDRYTYDAEKRVALETWARVLDGILSGKPAPNILPMARRK